MEPRRHRAGTGSDHAAREIDAMTVAHAAIGRRRRPDRARWRPPAAGARRGALAAGTLVLVLAAACGEDRERMAERSGGGPVWIERVARSATGAAAPRPALLVMLHGIGADENDLVPLAGYVDPRFTVVTLRAPRRYQVGHAWFDLDIRPGGSIRPDVAQARQTLADLVEWLRAAPRRLGTDPTRTFLLGFSQGAIMSLGVLRTVPDLLAGVVALSGSSPDGLFESRAPRDRVGRVPLLVVHGTRDDVLPLEHGRRARDAFAAVSTDLTYREYPVGHGIDGPEIAFVAAWLTTRLERAGAPSGGDTPGTDGGDTPSTDGGDTPSN
jgi:phospholipase/carboxylesterase